MMDGLKNIILIVNDAGSEIVNFQRVDVAENGADGFVVPAAKLQSGHTMTVLLRGIDENPDGDRKSVV